MINYEDFENKIIKYKLRERWRDGLFAISEEDKAKRENEFYLKAKRKYTLMMNSYKNDGSLGYYHWAMSDALGITPTKVNYKVKSDKSIVGFIY